MLVGRLGIVRYSNSEGIAKSLYTVHLDSEALYVKGPFTYVQIDRRQVSNISSCGIFRKEVVIVAARVVHTFGVSRDQAKVLTSWRNMGVSSCRIGRELSENWRLYGNFA